MIARLALIADVHADVHALRDALAQIDRLGCDEVICLGDVIDFGLFPSETIALLRERSIECVRGNHDRWAVRDGHDESGWDLPDDAVAWLESLPTDLRRRVEGVRVAFWHARPRSDMDGVYPDISASEAERLLERAEADILVVGHTHVPLDIPVSSGRKIANPGALLRHPAVPMEEGALLYDPETQKFVAAPHAGGGTFGILELPSGRFTAYRAEDGAPVEITRGR